MSPLLAELVAPPLQSGPVRWPAPPHSSSGPPERSPPGPTPSRRSVSQPADGSSPAPQLTVPWIQGRLPYGPELIRRILEPCLSGGPAVNLGSCAELLTQQLHQDGYLQSRVTAEHQPAPGGLAVHAALIGSLAIEGADTRLNRLAARWLRSLRHTEFHQPTLNTRLDQLRDLDHVAQVQSQIRQVDPADGSLTLEISIEPQRSNYSGEIAISDEGNIETGELKTELELEGTGIFNPSDTLFVYGEVNTNASVLGYTDLSLSYETSLADALRLSTGLGLSRNKLITGEFSALDEPEAQIELEQELELHLSHRPGSEVAVHIAIDLDRTLTGSSGGLSDLNGYLRLGLRASRHGSGWGWSAMLYGLQAIANSQQPDLVGSARALGGWSSGRLDLGNDVSLRLRGAGQLALAPLTPAMDFGLGSDIGLRGLPGEVIAGDNGLMGSAEIAWSFWRPGEQLWQLVPFLGAGRVGTDGDWASLGSIGAVLRWLPGSGWMVEVGALHQFGAEIPADRPAWLLGRALTSRLVFRF